MGFPSSCWTGELLTTLTLSFFGLKHGHPLCCHTGGWNDQHHFSQCLKIREHFYMGRDQQISWTWEWTLHNFSSTPSTRAVYVCIYFKISLWTTLSTFLYDWGNVETPVRPVVQVSSSPVCDAGFSPGDISFHIYLEQWNMSWWSCAGAKLALQNKSGADAMLGFLV